MIYAGYLWTKIGDLERAFLERGLKDIRWEITGISEQFLQESACGIVQSVNEFKKNTGVIYFQ